ncbi:hypothetical protein F4819DRAFT_504555 [Hypoxylon fuscum]|nr:hypothetical protein F4819DRAFT_504555 [Hypoxylon fuscum]
MFLADSVFQDGITLRNASEALILIIFYLDFAVSKPFIQHRRRWQLLFPPAPATSDPARNGIQPDTTENGTQLDPPQPEAPQPEAPQPEAPQPEAPQPEAPQPEAPQPEAPQPEAPQPEAPQPEAPQTDNAILEAFLAQQRENDTGGPEVLSDSEEES